MPRIITKSERINFASPIWSADGQYIIAARTGQLWIYNTDGGSGVPLTGLRPEGAAPPAAQGGATPFHSGAAPSGGARYLWVNVSGNVPATLAAGAELHTATSAREEAEEQAARSNARRIGQYQIGQFDRETGRTLVRSHETFGAFRPVASPDGKWLVRDVQRDNSQGGADGRARSPVSTSS